MIYSKEKRREARYTTIEDSLRILAILPPDMWRWEEVARYFTQGVINAANDPIDENLQNRDWFAFALTLLKDDPKQSDYEWSCNVERSLYNEREEKKVNEAFDQIVLALRRFEDAYYDVHADLPFTERPGSHPVIAAIRKLRDDRNLKLFSCIDTPLSHYTSFVFLRLLETRETPFNLNDMFPSSFENGSTTANRILLDVEAMRERPDIGPDDIYEYIDSVAYSHGMVYRAEKNRQDESANLLSNNPVLCENMRFMTEAPPELSVSQKSAPESENASVVKADMEEEENPRVAAEEKAKKDAAKKERKAAKTEAKAAQAAKPDSEKSPYEVMKGNHGRFEFRHKRGKKGKQANGITIHDTVNKVWYKDMTADKALRSLKELFVEYKDGEQDHECILPLGDIGWKGSFNYGSLQDFYNEQTESYSDAHQGATPEEKYAHQNWRRIIPNNKPIKRN